MTDQPHAEVESLEIFAGLMALTADVTAWTPAERAEAVETLGSMAIIAGTVGHADHVRVAEALSRLRQIIRAVSGAVEEGPHDGHT